MLVPNRHGNVDGYRYGFNGMEKDDELKDEGNSYDFGARMLDPRVGRWFSPDKMESKYPSLSSYVAFANNPIFFVDPDGNDIEPWKWFRNIFGFKFGPYYSLSNHYNSDTKFDKAYTSLHKSSNIFRKVINQLENSSRTYKFSSVYNSSKESIGSVSYGQFEPNHKGTKEDPFTINFMIDYKAKKTYADDKSTIFEETFHAGQKEFSISSKFETSNLALEVEAKLVKNIEGIKGLSDYEVMKFKGSAEIFEALRTNKKLTQNQKKILSVEIQKLAVSVSEVYSYYHPNDYSIDTFISEYDLKFAEKLYQQDLTIKSQIEEVVVKSKSTKKKK